MLTVDEIMTMDPVSVAPGTQLTDVTTLMKNQRVRHLPVVDGDGKLLGLVTQRDLLASGPDRLVDDIMRTKVFTALPNDELRGAALLMQQHKIGSLPVLDVDGRVIGIVTDSDYVSLAINLLEQIDETEPPEFDDDDDFLDDSL